MSYRSDDDFSDDEVIDPFESMARKGKGAAKGDEATALVENAETHAKAVRKEDAFSTNVVVPKSAMNTQFASSQVTANSAKKNERGFYEATVLLRAKASLRQLMAGGEATKMRLGVDAKCFEVPGTNPAKRTTMHAQGNVVLTQVRNGFPGSIGLRLMSGANGLRGAEAPTSHSSDGVTAHHIAIVDDKMSYEHVDMRLAHSDLGDLTEKFAIDYPDYLSAEKLANSVQRIPENSQLLAVKTGSPVHGAINAARNKMMKKAQADAELAGTENPHANDPAYMPLDENHEYFKSKGIVCASSAEVEKALKKMQRSLETRVNYVPLYENLCIELLPPFPTASESGANNAAAAWEDFVEKRINNGKPMDQAQRDAMLDEVHTLHARLRIEYVPLKDFAEKAAAAKK